MGFNCGIVGLPNVGKSTLFNALTSSGVDASNYPFCTIDPNVGIVNLPDKRLDVLSKIYNTKKEIPTTVEFVDIAGLVKGASQGEGLGNQFLQHIREVDAIVHVVRCFDNDNVVHVDGSVNPKRDIEVIETELILKDVDTVEKKIQTAEKKARSNDKAAREEVELLNLLREHLLNGRLAKYFERTEKTAEIVRDCHLLTDKPVMYVANTNEEGVKSGNKYIDIVREIAALENNVFVSICANLESEIAELAPEDREVFLAEMGMTESGLDRMALEGYKLLGLITFFTAGEKETRAWTVKKGAKAPNAAGVIHTDFEKGFIRAETIKYEDVARLGSEAAVKEAGLYKLEGKEYVVQDGDVFYFRFNV